MSHSGNKEYLRQQDLVTSLVENARRTDSANEVQIIETHISWVLIIGQYAYKFKKAINLGFLDFSDLEARKFYCEEEIRLNSRFAPEIYIDAVPIGGAPDNPSIDALPAVEYAVRMHSFPQHALLGNLLLESGVSPQLMNTLASSLANIHKGLPSAKKSSIYGSSKFIHKSLRKNSEQLLALLSDQHDCDSSLHTWHLTEIEFNQCNNSIQSRHAQGLTRESHGDLHVGNIVLIGDRLVPFDGIEFDPALRWIDLIDEVSFLVMDLLHAQRSDLAFRFLNVYMEETGDYAGISVLRFYISYRAQIRAKIFALRASQVDEQDPNHQQAVTIYRSYMALADEVLYRQSPALIITHGLPGSGKSTISQFAIEHFLAIRLRSDVERKRLFGLHSQENGGVDHGKEMYSTHFSRLTYKRLLELASKILAAGYSVIVDAAFLKKEDRDQFQKLAQNMAVPFAILSIRASDEKLKSRILQRQSKLNDASEADLAVLEHLKATQDELLSHELVRTVEFENELDIDQSTAESLNWNSLEEMLAK